MSTVAEQLQPFLSPKGVAVIGASSHPTKLGYGVLKNLVHPEWGFPGPVYPINPKAKEILGLKVYPHIREVPDPVDLAVILIPAPFVPQAVEDCGKRGVKGVVVVSGGFRELGEEGARLQQQVVQIARRYGMRVMGPNGIGVIDTVIPLNTTFVRSNPLRGHVSFISQSGALCGASIDWSRERGIGFARMYSVGNQADLVETDFLQVLAEDDHTRVIALYVEEISNGRRFYEVAREVARRKPILFLKAGRTQAGHEAAKSHTGALAGQAAAYRAACEDAGVIWCTSLQELLETAHALAHNPVPPGRRVAVITNAGGAAALAADALAEEGLELAHPSPASQARLREYLPPAAQVASVVDMLGGAGPNEYRAAAKIILQDPQVDAAEIIHVPQATVNPDDLVAVVRETRQIAPHIPVIMTFPGHESVHPALVRANRDGLTATTFPEDAARIFRHLVERADILKRPAQPPQRPPDIAVLPDMPSEPLLTDWDMRPLLAAYGIPTPAAALAHTVEEAVQAATTIGFPVALKAMSRTALHKSDVGGLALGLRDARAVEQAARAMLERFAREEGWQGIEVQKMVPEGVEVILGVVQDPQFGPLVMFGTGGIWVEVLKDVAFAIPPLTEERARALVERTRASVLLRGGRGRSPGDVDALVDTLVRLSWLAVDWSDLQELDINPLFVLPQGVVAVDARARTTEDVSRKQ